MPHTLGPWKLERQGGYYIYGADDQFIASVGPDGCDDYDEVHLPDAALIAAAPDLLDAAEMALDLSKYYSSTHSGNFSEFVGRWGVTPMMAHEVVRKKLENAIQKGRKAR